MIRFENVGLRYGMRPDILRDLNFQIAPRSFQFLTGPSGAGKTTLIRAICRQLGTEEEATSPTFALVNTYSYRSDGREALVHHMDLYRVNRIEETLEFGIEEYLDDPYFCLIEWPEVIEALLPDDVIRVRISAAGESVRKIVFL